MSTAARPNDKMKVRAHYDRMSLYYHSLWGEHIHRGEWIRGHEFKETAQVQLIEHLAEAAGVNAKFLLDVVWSVESISHYQDIPRFFTSAGKLLKPGGTLAITDWFKRKGLTLREHKRFLHDLEHRMMVELQKTEDYARYMAAAGLKVVRREVLNKDCSKTRDFCLDILKDKSLWDWRHSMAPHLRANRSEKPEAQT